MVGVDAGGQPVFALHQVRRYHNARGAARGSLPVRAGCQEGLAWAASQQGGDIDDVAALKVVPEPPLAEQAWAGRRPVDGDRAGQRHDLDRRDGARRARARRAPAMQRQDGGYLTVGCPAEDGAAPRQWHAVRDRLGEGGRNRLAQGELVGGFHRAVPCSYIKSAVNLGEYEKTCFTGRLGHQGH